MHASSRVPLLVQAAWSRLLGVRERLIAIVPGLLVMVVLIAVGLLAGWLARAAITRLARAVGFDRLMERGGVGASFRRAGIVRSPSDAVGLIAFWAIFIVFASTGVDAIALPG